MGCERAEHAAVLWEQVAGGFSAGQQRELAQRVTGDLGLGGKKSRRTIDASLVFGNHFLLVCVSRLTKTKACKDE